MANQSEAVAPQDQESGQDNIMQFPVKSPYRPETAELVCGGHAAFLVSCDDSAVLAECRKAAIDYVATNGLPTPRLERWKYTNIIPQIKQASYNADAIAASVKAGDEYVTALSDELSDDDFVRALCDIPAPWDRYEDVALLQLSNAFVTDGFIVRAPKGKAIADAVELSYEAVQGGLSVPRLVIELAEGAELTVIETHQGAAKSWNNAYAQIRIGANAKLKHYRVVESGAEAVLTQNTHITIARDGKYEAFALVTGGALTRNQIHVEIQGENAECFLNGINLLRDKQHGDVTFTMDHQSAHCHSDQFVRNVLDDRACGVYQGKVHVYKDAQKTDAYQMANALLLSEGAEMDTKPELEIYADDVCCSHGTTTGQLDEDPVFYLRSRGLDEAAARALLIEAYLGEVLERISDEDFQELCGEKVKGWLSS